MAECPTCGSQASGEANSCPACAKAAQSGGPQPVESVSISETPAPVESSAPQSSSRKWVYGLIALVLGILAFTFLGFYTIQPIGAVPEGQTWLVWRQGDETFFESADGRSLRRTGSVSLLSRGIALGQAPKDRIIVRLPYWEFAYRQSTDGVILDR